MGSLVLTGNTSGSVTVAVPDVAGSNTATIGAATGTHYPFTAGTAVASTSGTSIDFTGIPSWVKRVTVMFNGVSTSGSSVVQVQIGAGSAEATGYSAMCAAGTGTGVFNSITTGFPVGTSTISGSTFTIQGNLVFTLQSSNTWTGAGNTFNSGTSNYAVSIAGVKTISGTLDRIRITTVNGTDTFDAGSINILYE